MTGRDEYSSFTTIAFPHELPAVRRGDHWLARAGEVELRFSNMNKVFWPESGFTKGDLVTYYFNVAPVLLRHLDDRPLTLKRQPEGVQGPYWYEKDAPAYAPDWLPRLEIEAEEGSRTIRFATITNLASLMWIANVGCIELHPHHSRGAQQTRPTYAVFDLDPFPPAGFEETRYVASLVKVVLDGLGIASYPKTSGRTGMQIYVPTDGEHPYDDVRRFVTKACALVHRADPGATTLEWDISKRAGKVFLDANMNRAGASLAAAYSVRAAWSAPVSMPFPWEVLGTIQPSDFTIATVPQIVDGATEDAFAGVAAGGASLADALAVL